MVWWWWSGRDDLKMGGVERSHRLKTVQMWSIVGSFSENFRGTFFRNRSGMAEKVAQKSVYIFFLVRKRTPICKGAPRNFGRSEEGLFLVRKKISSGFFF